MGWSRCKTAWSANMGCRSGAATAGEAASSAMTNAANFMLLRPIRYGRDYNAILFCGELRRMG
jgi:hypothetical protein